MARIALQAGHINTDKNIDEKLRGSTGAPNEQEFTLRTQKRVAELLRQRGFEVVECDATANSNPDITTKDFDLFLSIHGDSVYPSGVGGGFIDWPDPLVDKANERSKELANAMISEYFKHSGIVEHPERSNANTKRYYMWNYLTDKTPCVIIECGVVNDAHDRVIMGDTDIIANAIVRGLCKGFGVAFDLLAPVSPLEITVKELTAEKVALLALIDEMKIKYIPIEAKYTELVSQGVTSSEELLAERKRHEDAFLATTTHNKQLLERLGKVESLLASKDTEESRDIDHAAALYRENVALKNENLEIKRRLGASDKKTFRDLMEHIGGIMDYLNSKKTKAPAEFTPGKATPVMQGKTEPWWAWLDFWKASGIAGCIMGAITGLVIFMFR